MTDTAKDIVRGVLVVVIFVGVVAISHRSGVPDKLPGIALGWPLLFHVERASALLGGIGVVLLVGWRATHNEFPVKFGQVEYAIRDAAAVSKATTEAQERRLQYLEVLAGVRQLSELDVDDDAT